MSAALRWFDVYVYVWADGPSAPLLLTYLRPQHGSETHKSYYGTLRVQATRGAKAKQLVEKTVRRELKANGVYEKLRDGKARGGIYDVVPKPKEPGSNPARCRTSTSEKGEEQHEKSIQQQN